MIQLLILFFVVVFIIAIIMLYKKYIRIKNVVDEELDRKYNKVKKAVGSNNKQIKQLKKDASELINTPNNDTNTLQEKINNNRDKIAENRAEMVDNNFQEINKVFKYESGFIVGGNAGQLRIGSDNIQLNVPNPVQVRVCDEQSCDSNIFTMRNTEDSIPVVINENVDSGVDESKNHNIDDNIVYSLDANGVKDNYLEFNNDTKILSTISDINIMAIQDMNENSIIEKKHDDCELGDAGLGKLMIQNFFSPIYCSGNLLKDIDKTISHSFKITQILDSGGNQKKTYNLISDGNKIISIILITN